MYSELLMISLRVRTTSAAPAATIGELLAPVGRGEVPKAESWRTTSPSPSPAAVIDEGSSLM